MNEEEIARLVVSLTGNSDGFMKMFDTASEGVKNFVQTTTGAFAALSGAVGATGALESFNRVNDDMVRLEEAAKANGLAIESAMDGYLKFSQTMEEATRVGAVQTKGLLAMAAGYGLVGEKAQQAVRMATAIQALNPTTSVQGALASVSMYLKTGYTRRLAYELGLYGMGMGMGGGGEGRGGGGMRGAANSPQMRAEIQKRLNQGWEVAIRLSKTLAGQMERLRNAFRDMGVEVGKIVSKYAEPMVQWLQKGVRWFNELDPIVKTVALGTAALGGALALVVPAFTILTTVLGSVAAGFTALAGLVSWPAILSVGALAAVVAIVVRRLGGIEAAWDKIQTGAKLAWGYVKAYFHAFVRWATPYWTRFQGFLSEAWEMIYQAASRAWDYTKAKAEAFFEWVWPIAQAWWSYATALWEAVMDAAGAAWDGIKSAGGAVLGWLGAKWSSIADSINVDWKKVRDTVVDALLMMEFGVRNFGKVMDVAWLGAQYGIVKFSNVVKFFFLQTLPVLLNWFKDNWGVVVKSAFASWFAFQRFVGQSLQDLFVNLPKLLTGQVKLADLFKPAAEGFEKEFKVAMNAVAQTLPQMPKRQADVLEKWLKEQYAQQAKALQTSFAEFRKRKLAEFAKQGFLPPEVAKRVEAESKKVQLALVKPFAEGAKAIQKWEAVLYGSAESYSAVFEYFDKLDEQREQQTKLGLAGPAAVGGSGAAVPVPVPNAPPASNVPGGQKGGKDGLAAIKELLEKYMKQGWPVTIAGLGKTKMRP